MKTNTNVLTIYTYSHISCNSKMLKCPRSGTKYNNQATQNNKLPQTSRPTFFHYHYGRASARTERYAESTVAWQRCQHSAVEEIYLTEMGRRRDWL